MHPYIGAMRECRLQPQTRIALGLVMLLVPAAHLFGQEPQARWRLPHLYGAIVLDDMPGEQDREALEPLRLTMYNPAVEVTLSEQTEVGLAYDVDNGGDFVVGVLDPFSDNDDALVLSTTPSGNRIDLTVVNDAEGSESFSAQIFRLRALASLDPHTSANAFLQWNVTARTFAGKLRFRYNVDAGKNLWIGWNQVLNTNGGALEPLLPVSKMGSLILGCTYTF